MKDRNLIKSHDYKFWASQLKKKIARCPTSTPYNLGKIRFYQMPTCTVTQILDTTPQDPDFTFLSHYVKHKTFMIIINETIHSFEYFYFYSYSLYGEIKSFFSYATSSVPDVNNCKFLISLPFISNTID